MPTLYPETYVPKLNETGIAIAVRSEVLGVHGGAVVAQLRNFVRFGLKAAFLHDFPPGSDAEILTIVEGLP